MPIIVNNFVNNNSQLVVCNKHPNAELKVELFQEKRSIYLYYNELFFRAGLFPGRAIMITQGINGVLRKTWIAHLWCGF